MPLEDGKTHWPDLTEPWTPPASPSTGSTPALLPLNSPTPDVPAPPVERGFLIPLSGPDSLLGAARSIELDQRVKRLDELIKGLENKQKQGSANGGACPDGGNPPGSEGGPRGNDPMRDSRAAQHFQELGRDGGGMEGGHDQHVRGARQAAEGIGLA